MTTTQNTENITNPNAAFESIKTVIIQEAEDKIKKIKENAEIERAKILQIGKKEAEKIKNEALAGAENKAQQMKRRETSRKKLSAKMDYLKLRDEIIENVLVETRAALQKVTKEPKYKDLLKKLLLESGLAIDGGKLHLSLKMDDASLFNATEIADIAKHIEEQTRNATSITLSQNAINTIGGLRLERADGKMWIDNTFETRMQRDAGDIRLAILKMLE